MYVNMSRLDIYTTGKCSWLSTDAHDRYEYTDVQFQAFSSMEMHCSIRHWSCVWIVGPTGKAIYFSSKQLS